MMDARRAPGKRWSARSSVQGYLATGERNSDRARSRVVKLVVRWRLDGASRSATFSGRRMLEEARAFRSQLYCAYEGDWDADEHHRPVPPGWAGSPSLGRPARPEEPAANVVPIGRRGASLAPPVAVPGPRAVPVAGEAAPIPDVAELARRFVRHVRATKKRRGGAKRSPTTTMGYEKTLTSFVEVAVYGPGDGRLGRPGVEVGVPLRVDDPEAGVGPRDLIAAIGVREQTNLRVRAANERALRRWAAAVDREQRLADRQGRAPVLPEPPELRPEVPEARTIEELCRAVKAMFTEAYRRGKLSYQPWTAEVDDAVVHAGPIRFTTRNVANRSQVWRVAGEMAGFERASTSKDRRPCVETGERYEALVAFAGITAARPEETAAVRDSWVELDGDDPKVVLRGAEVYHPLTGRDGGRERARVELKHRPDGSVRVLHLRDEPELVGLLRRHRERFVATPEPGSEDPEKSDPHFFTTHLGLPIDLSNWGPKWWKPVVAKALSAPGEEHLADMPFRRLRAAAITHWLVQGRTLYWCAREAGNSQAVIEAHYQGVLGEVEYNPSVGRAAGLAAPLGTGEVQALVESAGKAELAQLLGAATVELRRRLDAEDSETAGATARLRCERGGER